MRVGIGLPAPVVALMRLMPAWPKLEAVAHTLPYDVAIVADRWSGRPLPAARWGDVACPVLVAAGGKSPRWMQNGMRALAEAVPGAEHRTLPGQTHVVKPRTLAPELIGFFSG